MPELSISKMLDDLEMAWMNVYTKHESGVATEENRSLVMQIKKDIINAYIDVLGLKNVQALTVEDASVNISIPDVEWLNINSVSGVGGIVFRKRVIELSHAKITITGFSDLTITENTKTMP